MNAHQISRIDLSPESVDCIVFWTKNPSEMLRKLDKLKDYHFYFQFTLNSYGEDIEPNVPSKNNDVIATFQKLSEKIGSDKVVWRYDPILLNDKYTIEYHINYFGKLAGKLKGYSDKCVISFVDRYKKTVNNLKEFGLKEISHNEKHRIAEEISRIAYSNNLKIDTCAEDIDLSDLNISHAKCIDDELIEKITGYRLNLNKDKNQRSICGCVYSVDIGSYNTCRNACRYCYANFNQKMVNKNLNLHKLDSPLLYGDISNEDKVTEKACRSDKERQLDLSFLKHP